MAGRIRETIRCGVGVVLVSLLALGCARSTVVRQALFDPQAYDSVRHMMVVPFENLTPFPEAGLIVSDLVADELRAWQGYRIDDRRELEARARDGEFALPLHWGRGEAIRFARALGADAVAYGTVLEYGYLREHRSVSEQAAFAVVLRVASTSTGRVLWSGTLLATGGGDLGTSRPALVDVSTRALRQGITEMFEAYTLYREGIAPQGAVYVEDGE